MEPQVRYGTSGGRRMRFDFYGRFELQVIRRASGWEVFQIVNGKQRRMADIFIPPIIQADEVERFLNDIYHELAQPGQAIRRIG